MTSTSTVDRTVRAPAAPTRLLIGTGVVLVLATGLAYLARAPLFEALAGVGEPLPDGVRPAAEAFCEWGPVAVVLVAGAAAVAAWLAGRRALVLGAAAGAVGSYLLSELVKILVREDRPCAGRATATLLECPEAGDWSWPSNHATVAGALAAACVLAVRWSRYLVLPLAAVVALARVVGGVHYLHDVTAGLALGVLVTVAAATLSGRLRNERRSRATRDLTSEAAADR